MRDRPFRFHGRGTLRLNRAGLGVVALLAITLVVVAWMLLGGGGSRYEVRALVESAGQLVKGNLVKVGGVRVGTVHAIDLTSDNQAQITLRITDPRFKPLHQGTIATIRNTSLSSVAGRQVALQPGPNSNPIIRNGGAIEGQDTRPIVDLDQLLNTLDAQARTSLQELVHGGAVAFGTHPRQADAALAALNPALSQARQTTGELIGDQATFERALVESAGVVSSVAARAGDLQAGVANGAQVANSVSAESQSHR
jgi:phospholipid/cholesterol/gamma-HCH transport system substrate-binding protein